MVSESVSQTAAESLTRVAPTGRPTGSPPDVVVVTKIDDLGRPGARRGTTSGISKAVILGAGPGTTLFPLANYYSKLELPLAGEPLMAHMLRWLSAQGIYDVCCICSGEVVRPESMRRLEATAPRGVRLRCHIDVGPHGPAGSLRYVATTDCDGPILVLGTGLWPVDVGLAGIVAFHQKHGGGVTVVGDRERRQGDAVGHVVVLANGRIREIRVSHESEARGASSSKFRPCGIYLIDPDVMGEIPGEGHLDLKEGLVAHLTKRGMHARSYEVRPKVPRLHDRGTFLSANRLALEGLGRAETRSRRGMQPLRIGCGTTISRDARITGPVVIGEHCTIEAGATIVGPVSIGDHCHIGRDARISNSILWNRVRLESGCDVSSSIVGSRSAVPEDHAIAETVVIDHSDCAGQSHFLSNISERETTIIHRNGSLQRVSRSSLRHRAYLFSKRAMDVVVAIVALVVLCPLFLLIAIAVRLDSRGPILFCQERCGRGGRAFTMYKFRSMVEEAGLRHAQLLEKKSCDGPMFKMTRDPRITRVGRLLRATSLDELPQLFNVLQGSMSLVGPRPLAIDEMRFAPGWRDIRLSVKPGITGLWQVSGRSDVGFGEWIRNDISMVRRQSLWLDLKILAKTVPVTLSRRGAR